MIDELLQKVQDSLDLERGAEDKRVAAYTKARRLLSITIGITQTVLANTQSDLARYLSSHLNIKVLRIKSLLPRPPSRTPNREFRTSHKREVTDGLNAKLLLKPMRRPELSGMAIFLYNSFLRDADRNTISQTLGIVNSQLRTLREQLALRIQAGDMEEQD